jgi:mono/diheme cytochrome c family protein
MKKFRPQYLLLGVALVFASVAVRAADQPTKTIKKVPVRDTALNGKEMFSQYCAVCHGPEAKGNGPAADALKKSPADLTQIARKNGGAFPEIRVLRVIKGDDEVTAHGSRDMPVWNTLFRSLHSQPEADLRANALMTYVGQLQVK